MKKLFSLLLIVMMLVSMTLNVSATTYSKTEAPDWLITKVCPDNADFEGTWPKGAPDNKPNGDIYEAFEIVNISGETLNLYDYTVTYNGNGRSNAAFEVNVVEQTPFKAGDYRDGSTFSYEGMPVNPDTCMVAPGEIVVIWSLFMENWPDNHGNGAATFADFRKHWSIPDSVKVIAWDGNSSTAAFQSGHDANFNLKNSGVGSYGIAKISDGIYSDKDGVTPASTYENIITWSNVDYDGGDFIKIADFNMIVCFEYDATGDDVRRAKFSDYTDEAKFGVLTDKQKASLGDLLKAKEPAATTQAPTTTAPKPTTTAAPAATTAAPASTPATADSAVIVAGMLVMAAALTLALRKKSVK